MKLQVTPKQSFTLIEILADNGAPASPQNLIALEEYSKVEFPKVNGKLLVVSGVPMSANALVALHYKNLFVAVAIANPRAGIGEIVHSVSPDYLVGTSVSLG